MWAIIRTVVVLPFVPVTAMIGMRDGLPGGKSAVDDGPARRTAARPRSGGCASGSPGAALTSTIAPPVSRTGRRDVGADEVDAGDVEPDDLRGRLGDLDVVGMGLDRPVDRRPAGRHVAGQRELDPRAVGRDVVEPEALVADQLLGRLVDLDPGQHLLVADAAARVLVRDVDELADRVLAVAGHARRHALGDRGDLAADDEAAVVVAGDVRLDDDVARSALGEGAREGGTDLLLGAQVEVDAAAVVAVERLDDAREAEPLRDRRRPRPRWSTTSARGTGRPAQSSSRLVRLLSDAMSTPIALVFDVIVARIRCWWTPWPNWTSEWRSSRMNGMSRLTASSMSAWVDGPNAWRSASRMSRSSSLAKSKKMRLVVGRDEVVDERDGHPARLEPDRLLAVLVDAVVLAVHAGRAGLAVADVGAGEVLELEGDVLGDVAGPGALLEPGDEAAAPAERAGVVLEGRQQRDERVAEARDPVGRELLEDAEVDEHPDDRLARPVVRAAQDAGLEDAQRGQRRGRDGGRGRSRGAFGSARFERGRLGLAVGSAVSVTLALLRYGTADNGPVQCTAADARRDASSTRPRRRAARGASARGPARAAGGRTGSRPAASGGRRR